MAWLKSACKSILCRATKICACVDFHEAILPKSRPCAKHLVVHVRENYNMGQAYVESTCRGMSCMTLCMDLKT